MIYNLIQHNPFELISMFFRISIIYHDMISLAMDRKETSMTECVILLRLPNGKVTFIGEDDEITVFSDRYEAIALALAHHLLQAFPYQIVELDELGASRPRAQAAAKDRTR